MWPTGVTSPSSMARSSLTCTGKGTSPISSSSTVPPSASSSSPCRSRSAPGEGAPHVPEEFALENARAEGGQADRRKRGGPPSTVAMNGLGDQFFAGAAFAGDEHGDVAGRDQGDLLEDGLHRQRGADQHSPSRRWGHVVFVVRGRVRRRVSSGRSRAAHAARRLGGLLQIERLGKIVVSCPLVPRGPPFRDCRRR